MNMNYFPPFTIDDREHWKRKDGNKSPALEVTARLIEHSWFRCKFGASRLAGSHDLHLSRGFIVHNIWIVRVVSRQIAARRNNVDKAELSAEWGRAARSFVGKKKTAHYSVDSWRRRIHASRSFTGRLLFLTTVEPVRLIANFASSGVVFSCLTLWGASNGPRLWWNLFLPLPYLLYRYIFIA